METINLQHLDLFTKIKEISNKKKFKIVELTQHNEIAITVIAKEIKLAYNKCSDYCSKLEKGGLVTKKKNGKEVLVKGNISLEKLSKALAPLIAK